MRIIAAVSIGVCVALNASIASADFIVVPPALEDTQGGLGGFTPFANTQSRTTGYRTQVVYDASLFDAVSVPQLITAIQFRPIDPIGGFFGTMLSVSDVRIQLSTTQRSDELRNPLSATFSDNIGADVTTVFTGPLTLTTSSTLLPNGTRAFDYTITLQTGFVYDPSAGNLLLDTLVPEGATSRGDSLFGAFPRFDTTSQVNDGIFSVRNVTSGSALTGNVGTSGPVTRFVVTPIPEPSSVILLGLGGLGVAYGMSRHRRTKTA